MSKCWKKANDEWLILAVGRLSPEKGHRYLIDAVAKVLGASPQLKFQVLIAGTGPEEKS